MVPPRKKDTTNRYGTQKKTKQGKERLLKKAAQSSRGINNKFYNY
jgi:hypothetical protein